MRILHVVGARPNFMKAAPVMAALKRYEQVEQILVHTGQHYDTNMSEIFFEQLGLPHPDINLEVGSDSHARQTARMMEHFEPVMLEQEPDLMLVYGDVNSTISTALVAVKLHVPVGHVEAGLRSFDRSMPEEINRLLTDSIADLLFTPSPDGDANLLREGIPAGKIHQVGNVMIDTLVRLLPKAEQHSPLLQLAMPDNQEYALITLHRPSNVDEPTRLIDIMTTLADISRKLPLIFPIHPRTRQMLNSLQFSEADSQLKLVEPLGYLDFLALQKKATLVITDSGGIQEETTFLGVPCLTMRPNTERPITVEMGTNIVIGQDMQRLRSNVDRILSGDAKQGQKPPLWDGQAAERIAKIIVAYLSA